MIDFEQILINQNDSTLREYQIKAKIKIYRKWQNTRSVMLQMPTGTGKTRVFTSVVKDLHNYSIKIKRAIKVLILVHRQELVKQSSKTLGMKYNIAHGIIMSKFFPQKFYPTQIASVQTLIKRLDEWKTKQFDLIIIDEAHHSLANSYVEIINSFPSAKILGVTATPYRLNGDGFKMLFNDFIDTKSISQFIKIGYLSSYKYYSIRPTSYIQQRINEIDEFDINGDFSAASMLNILSLKQVRSNIIESYTKYAKGLKGIVYTINKHHNQQVCNDYNNANIKAAAVDSDTKPEVRNSIINKFIAGEIKVLCNVNIFNEGFDCPDIEFIQLARPTQSLSMYLQQVGRGLRPHENKDMVVIIDNVGLYNEFGLPSTDRNWRNYFDGTISTENVEIPSSSNDAELHFMDDIEEGNEPIVLIEANENSTFKIGSTFDYFLMENQERLILSHIEYDDIANEYEWQEEDEDDFFNYVKISNLSIVEKLGKLNLLNRESNLLVFEEWLDEIHKPNALGIAFIKKNNKFGLANIPQEKLIHYCEYDSLVPLYHHNRIHEYIAELNNDFGLLNDSGEITIPFKFKEIYPTNSINNVYLNDLKGWKVFLPNDGIIDEYDGIEEDSNYGIVEYNNLYGFWSYEEELLIHPIIYDSIKRISNVYIVSIKYSWFKLYGVYNESLELIVRINYSNISILNERYIKYNSSKGWGLLSIKGENMLEAKYQNIAIYKNNFMVMYENLWKVLDSNLNVLSEARKKADAIKTFENILSRKKTKKKRPRIRKKRLND
jgi:superfamily II DNA or RNA helicase